MGWFFCMGSGWSLLVLLLCHMFVTGISLPKVLSVRHLESYTTVLVQE